MADISASTVMELRQRTGLGMMECKKALTEAAGDLTKAGRPHIISGDSIARVGNVSGNRRPHDAEADHPYC